MNNEKNINVYVENINRVGFFIPACFEHAIISYGITIGKDFKKAFFNTWNFLLEETEKKDKKIGTRINVNEDMRTVYRKYFGMIIIYKKVLNICQLINVIKKNVDMGIPTMIHLDTYYSFWGMLYLKEHSNHIGFAVGINEANNKVYIVDPDYSNEAFAIEIKLLEKLSTFYYEIKQNKGTYEHDYKSFLYLVCENKSKFNFMFDNIKKLADLFKNSFDPQIEFEEIYNIDCILHSEIIENIRKIIKSRNMFILFLEEVNKHVFDVNKIIEYLYVSIGKWNSIMNIMFKASRTIWKDSFQETVYYIINDIVIVEKKAFYLLCDKVYSNYKWNYRNYSKKKKKLEYISLNLLPYCNNKGFLYNDKKYADLTGADEYFILSQQMEKIFYNGIEFDTYFTEEYDNIVCKGQKLEIDIECEVNKLIFLTCAEWGFIQEGITIISVDGNSEIYMLYINDISNIDSDYVIELGITKSKKGKIINNRAGITYNEIILENPQKIKNIVLPVNPNMHILSIVVERA